MRRVKVIFVALGFALGLAASAGAQVIPTGVEALDLPFSTALVDEAGAVAYIPAFARYYSGGVGSTGLVARLWTSTGTSLGTASPGVDTRGLYFNSNDSLLESPSFSACCSSGSIYGLFSLNLDGTGGLDGTNTMLLAGPLAGLGDDQTMPSYDPVTNHLFAKQDGTATVNVVNRTSGALASTITLNLGAAGVATASDVNYNYVGFTGLAGEELALFDYTAKRVLVFDLSGAFVGASALPGSLAIDFSNQHFGSGYTNGLFFVWDPSLGTFGGYRGFQVLAGSGASAVPALSVAGMAVLAVALALAAAVALQRGSAV